MFSQPLQMLLVMLAGLMNRQDRAVVDYVMEENRVLLELLGKMRLIAWTRWSETSSRSAFTMRWYQAADASDTPAQPTHSLRL